jgi:site-specific recombinase XerD
LLDRSFERTVLGPHVLDYLRWKENEDGARPRTIDQYERDLSRMCLSLPQSAPADVTTEDVRRVRDTFPKLSRKRVTSAYKDFWRWMVDESRVAEDPAARIRNPSRTITPVQDVFTLPEVMQLHAAQRSVRDRLGVALLLHAGVRAAEIRHLRVEDVDVAQQWINVREGKGGKPRVIPVRGRLVELLTEFLTTPLPKLDRLPQRGDHLLYATGAGPYGPTWVRVDKPIVYSTFWRWWHRCVDRAGVRYRKPHMTRHTYATNFIRTTNNPAAAQRVLGHASIRTTIDTYTHLDLLDIGAAVETMESALDAAGKVSAQVGAKVLQMPKLEAPSRFELLYEALQASA